MATHTGDKNKLADQNAMVAAPKTTDQRATDDLSPVNMEHFENVNKSRDPISAVLDLPELFEMTLSNLSLKDLTRVLTVSKQWHEAILGSIKLRRKLFLAPLETREFLVCEKAEDGRRYRNLRSFGPTLEPDTSQPCRLVVEMHPALADWSKIDETAPRRIDLALLHKLKEVSAHTLCFQPPLKSVDLDGCPWFNVVHSGGGVTFGALVKSCERIQERARLHEPQLLDKNGEMKFVISVIGVVLSGASEVIDTRDNPANTQDCVCDGEAWEDDQMMLSW